MSEPQLNSTPSAPEAHSPRSRVPGIIVAISSVLIALIGALAAAWVFTYSLLEYYLPGETGEPADGPHYHLHLPTLSLWIPIALAGLLAAASFVLGVIAAANPQSPIARRLWIPGIALGVALLLCIGSAFIAPHIPTPAF